MPDNSNAGRAPKFPLSLGYPQIGENPPRRLGGRPGRCDDDYLGLYRVSSLYKSRVNATMQWLKKTARCVGGPVERNRLIFCGEITGFLG